MRRGTDADLTEGRFFSSRSEKKNHISYICAVIIVSIGFIVSIIDTLFLSSLRASFIQYSTFFGYSTSLPLTKLTLDFSLKKAQFSFKAKQNKILTA